VGAARPTLRCVAQASFLERCSAWLRARVRLVDCVLVGLLVVFVVVVPSGVLTPGEALISLGLLVPLAWRRTAPVPAAAAVTLFGIGELLVAQIFLPANVAVLVMIYSLAAYAPWWASRAGLILGLIGAPLGAFRYYVYNISFYGYVGGSLASELIMVAAAIGVTVIASWALGSLRRIRLEEVSRLEERARLMEHERAQELRLAASGERARIARDMHDVVAHSLSVVIAQADGGRYAGRTEPQAALGALEAIAGTGRQALTDMRGLLGVLRDDSQTTFAPQPDAAAIPALVDDVRGSGLTVDLLVEGQPRPLPTGQGLAAYRIVQESLTNVLKHAGPAGRAWVTVRWFEGHLDLSIIDDGRGASAALANGERAPATATATATATANGHPQPSRGHGILGMQERASLYGGQFSAAPRSGGGFGVQARIPYPRGT